MSQNVTGVVDRNAPDVVVQFLLWVFKLRITFINKQTTTDGYETNG